MGIEQGYIVYKQNLILHVKLTTTTDHFQYLFVFRMLSNFNMHSLVFQTMFQFIYLVHILYTDRIYMYLEQQY